MTHETTKTLKDETIFFFCFKVTNGYSLTTEWPNSVGEKVEGDRCPKNKQRESGPLPSEPREPWEQTGKPQHICRERWDKTLNHHQHEDHNMLPSPELTSHLAMEIQPSSRTLGCAMPRRQSTEAGDRWIYGDDSFVDDSGCSMRYRQKE